MNLPEGELRRELQRLFSKATARFDDFDLLSIVGSHQLGRVTVLNPGQGDTPAMVSLQELLTYRGTEDLIDYLLNTYARYSGVSGVQPKVLVRDEQTAAVERITQRTATHIVKTWRDDQYPHLAANEFFCLRAAEFAGLPVPEFSLSEDGRLLIVKRFDLPTGDAYLGFEDLCALNGWSSEHKYEGSYESCAKQLRSFASPENRQEVLNQFFLSVVISCALQNGDAHRKNFGVLYNDGADSSEVWAAPAYDIVTTTAYLPQDTLALLLAGSKRWPKADALVRFGRTACGLSEATVTQLMDQAGDGISRAKTALIAYSNDVPAFGEIAQKMLMAWDAGQSLSLRNDRGTIHSMGLKSRSSDTLNQN